MRMTETIRAEMSVVGVMAMDAEACAEMLGKLRPEMFEAEKLGAIFAAAAALHAEGQPVDVVTLLGRLGDDYKQPLVLCAETVPSISNVGAYAALVYDAWRRRLLTQALLPVTMDAGTPGVTADSMVQALEAALEVQHKLAEGQSGAAQDFAACVDDFIRSLDEDVGALKSGFGCFDARGLFAPGSVIAVAADTGGGKTDFAINVAARMALRHRVLYFTLEMSKRQLMRRIAARITRTDGNRIKMHKLSADEKNNLTRAMELMKRQAHLTVDDTGGITPEEVQGKVLQYKPEMIVIDHIGLMTVADSRKDERQRLVEVTARLKQLAKRQGICVIELVQLNRDKQRKNAPPVLADLKGSSTIEQDADAVLMLRSDPVELHGNDGKRMEVYLRKEREGSIGMLELFWQPQFARLSEIDNRHGDDFMPVPEGVEQQAFLPDNRKGK